MRASSNEKERKKVITLIFHHVPVYRYSNADICNRKNKHDSEIIKIQALETNTFVITNGKNACSCQLEFHWNQRKETKKYASKKNMQVITKRHIALYCQRDCFLKISFSRFFNCFCEKKGKKAATTWAKNDAMRCDGNEHIPQQNKIHKWI